MLKQDFAIMLITTVIETIFLNNAVLDGQYFWAGFWGLLLFRSLRKTYVITKFTKAMLSATKKKD
ncbi:DUF3272 family protein [Streptococcus ratti]|uniref:DUF3272 family protein n=2 Tax=Streptococcus ratti TaxID=1341 RepID=A0A7X9LG23_STRRT|nr:DUF3272 family protein [Streptococcus ratti]VEI60559.1 Protein of uncharacterised function (DUF3272) [Streptococcus mutans]EJN94265.1 hypothetical protein SRA_07006 [Streptococcus ratti FA-1 = DSM 20564]EMP70908.1 hypothetical protein D822_03039 [Streptococcus ratti FA-1 = DSM 20564]NMD49205.1 DUF3272 family protein [Streptococcus ratti]QEY06219.1 DUF3272 family protein [Streptococcus ratti]